MIVSSIPDLSASYKKRRGKWEAQRLRHLLPRKRSPLPDMLPPVHLTPKLAGTPPPRHPRNLAMSPPAPSPTTAAALRELLATPLERALLDLDERGGRGLHSFHFSAQHKHVVWDTFLGRGGQGLPSSTSLLNLSRVYHWN
jgi:hypothetical protein